MMVLAGGTALVAVLLFMPAFIALVRRLAWGQQIREEGPADHKAKAGTPTMGGLVITAGLLLGSLWALGMGHAFDVLVMLVCVAANCAIGFFDDYAKIRKQNNLGLSSRQKLIAQTAIGALLGFYLITADPSGATIVLPGLGQIHSAGLAFVLAVMVMLGATNGVNLTDGLDGLAGGTVAVAALAYVAIAAFAHRPDLAACAAAMAGACLGFLYYNRYPARIFMGDTGSLALGGGLTSLAVLTRTEWLLVPIGGIFVLETLSVMIQVGYFKLTHGRRIFRMSPLHHHFCLGGWHETRVTSTFWTLGGLFGLVGVALWWSQRAVWPPL